MYWDFDEELERIHQEMDRLFRKTFMHGHIGRDLLSYQKQNKRDNELIPYGDMAEFSLDFRRPICHLQETEKNIIAAFELPGVNKENIELNLDDRSIELKVQSKKEKKHEENDKKMYSYSSQSFYRKIALPKEIDSSKASAEYKDGILRVEMPKKENDKERKKLQIK